MTAPNPQEKEPISFRLKRQIKSDLVALAEATGRPQTVLIEEALEGYIDLQKWQIEGIQQAIKSLDNGEYYTINQALDILEKRREKRI